MTTTDIHNIKLAEIFIQKKLISKDLEPKNKFSWLAYVSIDHVLKFRKLDIKIIENLRKSFPW